MEFDLAVIGDTGDSSPTASGSRFSCRRSRFASLAAGLIIALLRLRPRLAARADVLYIDSCVQFRCSSVVWTSSHADRRRRHDVPFTAALIGLTTSSGYAGDRARRHRIVRRDDPRSAGAGCPAPSRASTSFRKRSCAAAAFGSLLSITSRNRDRFRDRRPELMRQSNGGGRAFSRR